VQKTTLKSYFPILSWAGEYNRDVLFSDLLAALIVTIMLIPQSLAYALLAGLPPQMGLYASMLPLVAYGIFGTSRTLSVGPVAVVSLMTASAIGHIASAGSVSYIEAALLLAFLSGVFLLGMGLLRMGFLANFLSHPVIAHQCPWRKPVCSAALALCLGGQYQLLYRGGGLTHADLFILGTQRP
jgi:SulP family sulfate permease